MLRNFILTVIALTVSISSALAQFQPYPPRDRIDAPPRWRETPRYTYSVQFRQPYWRKQEFFDQASLDQFAQRQRANGWEVQVLPQGRHHFLVRYRLMNWGGSRLLPTREEAEQWAQKLEDEDGYETRIEARPSWRD